MEVQYKNFDRFSKIPQTSNFMKARQEGGEMFHADRRTDMMKLTVAFRNSANAPNSTDKGNAPGG